MKKLLAMSVLLVVTMTGCLSPGWFVPRTVVVTATPEGAGGGAQISPEATVDPWAAVGNCGGDVYAVGWGDADGRLIAATGQVVPEDHAVVYLRKNSLGQNVGAGILVEGGAALPSTGETVHAWMFISVTCARLNQPYINGK